jgi:hypothetical protein
MFLLETRIVAAQLCSIYLKRISAAQACVGIIMALGVLVAADEHLASDEDPLLGAVLDHSFVTPPQG